MIVGRSEDPDCDVDYLFAQVGIGDGRVEWGSNCGNCATAVGLYALQNGLVATAADTTTVRMRNLNTGARLTTTVPTPQGVVPESGDAMVPGAAARGVAVGLTFCDPAGATTGKLLPTGSPVDQLESAAGPLPTSIVDAGAAAALVDAAALGLSAAESTEQLLAWIPELAQLRRRAALAAGMVAETDPVSYAIPKVGLVGPAVDYALPSGHLVRANEYDLAVRMVSMHSPHPAIGLTSAVAVAAAAQIGRSVVARCAAHRPDLTRLRLGTLAGVVTVDVEASPSGTPRAVTLQRAARRIATAELLVPVSSLLTPQTATTPGWAS